MEFLEKQKPKEETIEGKFEEVNNLIDKLTSSNDVSKKLKKSMRFLEKAFINQRYENANLFKKVERIDEIVKHYSSQGMSNVSGYKS